MEKKGRILTGHRPTGPRHLGHLVGTLETWRRLQGDYQCFFLVADLHVLTTDFAHPDRIRTNTLEVVLDWLAAGIDPAQSTLVLQSAVPEHAQLSLLLSMLVTVPRLERVPTYKDQIQQLNLSPSLGLLTYPVLQAADILLYRADSVPVGEDQLPHLELARELARRMNQQYGMQFPEPQAILSSMPRLPGIDNRMMHTSYGNAIYIRDSVEETTRKVMQMYTDPNRLRATDPGHVEGNPVFTYLDLFDPAKEEVDELKKEYRVGKVGDVPVKQRLAGVLNQHLELIRARRMELAQKPDEVIEILRTGTERARPFARQALKEVYQRAGLSTGLMLGPHNDLGIDAPRGVYC
jgi:tryptophanyl-tRNA synthetase